VNKAKVRVLDRIDYKILRRLQENGRMTNADLARSVNLSPTPCLERVRRLEAEGYILDYVALLNPNRLGAGVVVFIQVQLDRTSPGVFERFKKQVNLCPEIVECHMVAGGFDYLLKVRTSSMVEYREFLGQTLAQMSDIKQTHTYVVMEQVKSTHAISV
jgi:Lrp/AsnC family leucine-responsive transcriptional regulator